MALFFVGDDVDHASERDPMEARDIERAVEAYVHEVDDGSLSDVFDVVARGEWDTRWRRFPVTLQMVLKVEVGDPSDGPLVDVGGDP